MTVDKITILPNTVHTKYLLKITSSAVFSGGAGGARAPPEFGGFRKGAKPDFCFADFGV